MAHRERRRAKLTCVRCRRAECCRPLLLFAGAPSPLSSVRGPPDPPPHTTMPKPRLSGPPATELVPSTKCMALGGRRITSMRIHSSLPRERFSTNPRFNTSWNVVLCCHTRERHRPVFLQKAVATRRTFWHDTTHCKNVTGSCCSGETAAPKEPGLRCQST